MEENNLRADSPYYKLLSHNLVITVLQNTSPVYGAISSSIKGDNTETQTDIKDRTKQILNEMRSSNINQYLNFQYQNEVFQYLSNISQAIERMEMTPIFLGRFPKSKRYDKNGINLHRWMQYHYANYIITVTSIYDTALLLTNAIFALGIKPRDCKDKNVTNSAQVKQTSVKSALDKLNEIIKNYREPRNLFAHRNIIPDLDMLDELEGLRFIEQAGSELDPKPEPIIHPRVVGSSGIAVDSTICRNRPRTKPTIPFQIEHQPLE